MASILVIDDNPALTEIMARVLTRAGYEVFQAGGGREAVRLLQEHPVDLVITDIVMPDQDGIEVIMWLRKMHPQMPVIAISGDSPQHSPLYLSMAKKLGAIDTLEKPVSADALLHAVKTKLG